VCATPLLPFLLPRGRRKRRRRKVQKRKRTRKRAKHLVFIDSDLEGALRIAVCSGVGEKEKHVS